MAGLRIVALAVLAAVVYGVLHDLVTANLCVEYFTIGHPTIVPTESPMELALVWGVLATWWVGLGLGLLLAFAARRGRRPPRSALSLVGPISRLLVTMAAVAAVAGGVGWLGAASGLVQLIGPLATAVPTDRHVPFLAVLWAHLASYAAAAIGGIVLCFRVWRSRSAK
jgi:hypothetical protein